MENKYHKLSYSKYFELAAEGLCLLARSDMKRACPLDMVSLVRTEGVPLFIAGYIMGKGYTLESIENLKEGIESMSDMLIKQYFEEALANG